MKKLQASLLLLVLIGSLSVFLLGAGKNADQARKISDLRIFNRTVLLVKEQYVEPERIQPRVMLLAALRAVEKKVAEVVMTEVGEDDVKIQVGKASRNFSVGGLTSLWDLSFRLRDVFRYMEAMLPANTDFSGIEYAAANGMLSKLDPHSMVLEPKFTKEVKSTTRGHFGGLGVVIGLREGFLTVISPVEGTPAHKAGVKALDRVVKINEDSTVNMSLDEAVELLRGKPGSTIAITVERKGEQSPRRILIKRAIIKVDTVTGKLLDDKYAYVNIKAFHGTTAKDVSQLLEQLKKKTKGGKLGGIILDVRNNPGGLFEQSVQISDLFLDGGTVVVTQGSKPTDREEENAKYGPKKTETPVIVLVNNGSASASEIVAGAIKNRERGIVMGEQTFGKGSVQLLYDFPDKSSLKLTVAQYLTPGDISIQSVGITPDILLTPIYPDDPQTLTLFPDERIREEDLDSHLNNESKTVKRKPSLHLSYVTKPLEVSEMEERAVKLTYHEDYEIVLAKKILEKVKGPSRKALLASAKQVLDKERKVESKRLFHSLKKHGVDWSAKPQKKSAQSKPDIVAKVVSPVKITAGKELVVQVDVTNKGKIPVYQVHGVSNSKTQFFNDREFVFGKLSPKEKKSWKVKFHIPEDALTRHDKFDVVLKGSANQILKTVSVPINIVGLPRPKLAYTYFIDDTKKGNGDGYLDVNENVEMVVLLKNIGKGVAEKPRVLVKNLSGSDIFVEEGRVKLSTLKPGEKAVAKLKFTLKSKKEAKVRLQLYDALMGDFWGEEITFPVRTRSLVPKATSGLVKVRLDDVALLSHPQSEGVLLASLKKDQTANLLFRVGEYSRIRLTGDISGFVKTSDVELVRHKEKQKQKQKVDNIRLSYQRVPAQIDLARGFKKPVIANGEFVLDVHVDGLRKLKDAFMYVNDQKVFYDVFDSNLKKLKFTRKIDLEPGVNLVTLVVREDSGYGQKQNLTIFSTGKNNLAKKNTFNKQP